MSIIKFIKKISVQNAVFWGNPKDDGSGGKTFDYPVQIKCRWTERNRIVTSSEGVELTSKAEVLTVEDLVVEGWLYLGNLTDIAGSADSSNTEINPMTIEGAYQIIAKDKVPLIRSATEFVTTYYLG